MNSDWKLAASLAGTIAATGAIQAGSAGMATEGVGAQCPVLESGNWIATVNRPPEPEQPKLEISGEVVLPTPGYQAVVRLGPLDRRQPARQIVNLLFSEPDGMVAQVLSTEELRFEIDASATEYRSVAVVCGDTLLAEITEIEDAR